MQTWRRYIVGASRYDFWPVKIHFVKNHYLFNSFFAFGTPYGARGPRGGPRPQGGAPRAEVQTSAYFLLINFGGDF